MKPKQWIPPERDRPVDGELRIVRLASGRLRATKWRAYYSPPHDPWPGCYADARGDGVDDVVAVGVTWEPRKRSGPSGKNTVKKQSVRIPDDLWSRFGTVASSQGRDRNAIVNQLVAEYVERNESR